MKICRSTVFQQHTFIPSLPSVSKHYEEDEADNVQYNHQDAKCTERVKQRKLDGAQEDKPTSFRFYTATIHCSHLIIDFCGKQIHKHAYMMGVYGKNYCCRVALVCAQKCIPQSRAVYGDVRLMVQDIQHLKLRKQFQKLCHGRSFSTHKQAISTSSLSSIRDVLIRLV